MRIGSVAFRAGWSRGPWIRFYRYHDGLVTHTGFFARPGQDLASENYPYVWRLGGIVFFRDSITTAPDSSSKWTNRR